MIAKVSKKKKTKTKKEQKKIDNLKISQIPGVDYKGSNLDPAVNALLDKLRRDGADSLNSSGFGNRYGSRLNKR